MSNVVGLRGEAAAQPGEPDAEVIAIAEQLLELARSGEVNGAVIVMHHGDGCVSSLRRGEFSFRVIGLSQMLVHDMCAALSKGREE